MTAENLVETLLENEAVAKWDGAYKSALDVYKLKLEEMRLWRERILAFACGRELARHGVSGTQPYNCAHDDRTGYITGAILKDGSHVKFDSPLHPRPWEEAD